MYTKIWKPGTDKNLDDLFEKLRTDIYNSDHKLARNYSKEHFDTCGALSITFNDNNEPFLCSSVLQRSCWPIGAWRISNRLWKTTRTKILNGFSIGTDSMLITQMSWLKENTDCELVFSSREGNSWMKWAASNLKDQFNLKFTISDHKYLTCDDCENETCWQYIIYIGNEEILNSWRKK